jgi:hypothetical protein
MHRLPALALILLAHPAVATPAPVPLIYAPPTVPGLAALPRLAASDTAAESINAALAAIEAHKIHFARGCLVSPRSDYSFSFEVTLQGPEYLSILTTDDFYCDGAAHGSWFNSVLLFDLTTAAAVEPLSLLPDEVRPMPYVPGSSGGVRVQPEMTALTELYIQLLPTAPPNEYAALNHLDCAAILRSEGHDFQVWPDAKAQALMLQPVGLAYFFSSCIAPVEVPLPLLQQLHAPPRLIRTLQVAPLPVPPPAQ